jgi:hypothetical protein
MIGRLAGNEGRLAGNEEGWRGIIVYMLQFAKMIVFCYKPGSGPSNMHFVEKEKLFSVILFNFVLF